MLLANLVIAGGLRSSRGGDLSDLWGMAAASLIFAAPFLLNWIRIEGGVVTLVSWLGPRRFRLDEVQSIRHAFGYGGPLKPWARMEVNLHSGKSIAIPEAMYSNSDTALLEDLIRSASNLPGRSKSRKLRERASGGI